jgi:hypothetical protein
LLTVDSSAVGLVGVVDFDFALATERSASMIT